MLRGALYWWQPRFPPLRPDLRYRLQRKRCVVEGAEADLDAGVVKAEEPRATVWTEAPAVVAVESPAELEDCAWPLTVDRERAPGLFSAVGAVAPPDM
jgi:hypothetical protein